MRTRVRTFFFYEALLSLTDIFGDVAITCSYQRRPRGGLILNSILRCPRHDLFILPSSTPHCNSNTTHLCLPQQNRASLIFSSSMPATVHHIFAHDFQIAPRSSLPSLGHHASLASDGHGDDKRPAAALRPALSRHYTSLQEHADDVNDTPDVSEDATTKTRQDSRRDGFTWGQKPAYDDHEEQRRQDRNPLPPEKADQGTPPSLEELLRQPNNDDADTAHNARVANRNRANSELSNTHFVMELPTPETATRRGGRKSSIAYFARGLVRHVSDLTMASVPDVAIEAETAQGEKRFGSVTSASSSKDGKEVRKLSIVSRSIPEDDSAFDIQLRTTSSAGDSRRVSNTKPTLKPLQASGSLRDRREAAFDLSLPLPESRLSAQDLQHTISFSSVLPAQPGSPSTPPIRNTPKKIPRWSSSQPTSATLESHTSDPRRHDPDIAVLPGHDAIESTQLGKLERRFTKVRERYHMTRPKRKSNRSSARTGASEDALASTPDGSWTPDDIKTPQEPPMRTKAELGRLYQTSRTARAGRWRWPGSTTRSSEGTPQTPAEQSNGRRFSINPFKRSARIAEHDDQDQKASSSPTAGRFWWIGKQPGSTPTQAKPATATASADAPTALDPVPASQRVSTVSTTGSSAKVGKQLADFAFDDDVGMRGVKPRQSPEGLWDSDALLMSYKSPDLDAGTGTDEEGPEGPRAVQYAPRGFTVECNPGCETPGIITPPTPGGYMEARHIPTPQPTPRVSSPDAWFRVQKCVTPECTPLTPHALKELEERRKFEWIVPEHLSGSPLCPLHPTYTGYSAGKCFWHGTKSKIVRIETRASGQPEGSRTIRKGMRGWEVGAYDAFPLDNKPLGRRRLASLSTP